MEGNTLTVLIEGRLDTLTAQDLEKELDNFDGVENLIIDLEKLEYISSSGLRVLLSCQKKMNYQGSMVIRNASDEIKNIFDITGFTNYFTIE